MGRPERPLDPTRGPVERLAWELRRLRDSNGRPSYRRLAQQAHFSASTLAEAAKGERLPSLEVTLAYAEACGGRAADWTARWEAAAAALDQSRRSDPGTARCPYPGLAPLQPDDAEVFFGRIALRDEVLRALNRSRLAALFGASGSGKSSLLRAGLLPALTDGDDRVVTLTPRRRPLYELAEALSGALSSASPGGGPAADTLRAELAADLATLHITLRSLITSAPDGTRAVLMIDQFEEVFTLCEDPGERAAFLDAIADLATVEDDRTATVIAVRADFYAHCSQHPALVAALRQNAQVPIGPPTRDELSEIIVRPAALAGVEVAPEVVATVLADAAGQPGALPMVAHAMRETWQRHTGDAVRLADYLATGGVRGAVAQTAEQVYAALDEPRRRAVRDLLLRLTTLGDGTGDTRRRIDRSELTGVGDPQVVEEVLHRLAEARLLVVDRRTVDLAHEALITAWPRLRRWLTDHRDAVRLHRRLTEAAAEWEASGREEGFLYRGAQLAAWDDSDPGSLNELEATFLAAARGREDRERRAYRRRVRRGLCALGGTAAAVSALAVFATVQAVQADAERDLSVSRRLVAEAREQLQLDPQLALLLARRAYAVKPIDDAEAAVRQATVDTRVRLTVRTGHTEVLGIAWSPDGRRVATGGRDGTVRLWEWSGGHLAQPTPVVLQGHTGEVWSTAFSRDGRWLATSGADRTVRVWDLTRGGAPVVLSGHRGTVWNTAFSPDGRLLASTSDDGTVRLWDRAAARQVSVLPSRGVRTLGVAFAPDGHRIAVGDGTGAVRIIKVAAAEPLRQTEILHGHTDSVENVAFSPDGDRLATASTDGTARVWQVEHGKDRDPLVLRGHAGTVENVTFAPDGRHLATTGNDGTVQIWRSGSAINPLVLRGHAGTVWGAGYSPDGRYLASAGNDGTIRFWDPADTGNPAIFDQHRGEALCAAFTPDGKWLVSGGQDGTVRVRAASAAAGGPGARGEAAARAPWPAVLRGHRGPVTAVAARPDGGQLASAGDDGTIRLWDPAAPTRPTVLGGGSPDRGGGPTGLRGLAYSQDGRAVAAGDLTGAVRIWQTSGHGPATVLRGHVGAVRSVAFMPGGRWLVSAGVDGTVRLWDRGRPGAGRVLHGNVGPVWDVAVSPDGRSIAAAGNDGTVRVWMPGGRGRPQVRLGHRGVAWSVAFSPDGRWLVSSGGDGTVRLWKVTGQGEPVVFDGFGATVDDAVFAPGGRWLATAHGDGTTRMWACEVCGPIGDVMKLAGRRPDRTLTAEERRMFLGGDAR